MNQPYSPSRNQPLYLDESSLRDCLPDAEVYEVVRATLARLGEGRVVNGPKSGFGMGAEGDRRYLGSVSGCVPDAQAAGLKMFMTVERNASLGLPRLPATVVVCNNATGILEGIVDATALTPVRTAAAAVACALACSQARADPPPAQAAVIGAGAIGRAIVRMLSAHARLDAIAIHAPRIESACALCDEIRAGMPAGPPLLAAPSARDAVAGAGLVFTATSVAADMSLVHADWLAPGAIVCALGSFREVDPSVVATASEIVVDDLQGVQARGNLAAEFRAGRLSPDRIAADVGALLSGRWTPRAGRSGPVLMAMVGMGVLDVALAARALGNARRAGLGLPLAGRKP